MKRFILILAVLIFACSNSYGDDSSLKVGQTLGAGLTAFTINYYLMSEDIANGIDVISTTGARHKKTIIAACSLVVLAELLDSNGGFDWDSRSTAQVAVDMSTVLGTTFFSEGLLRGVWVKSDSEVSMVGVHLAW